MIRHLSLRLIRIARRVDRHAMALTRRNSSQLGLMAGIAALVLANIALGPIIGHALAAILGALAFFGLRSLGHDLPRTTTEG